MRLSLINHSDKEIAIAIREKWMTMYGLERDLIEKHLDDHEIDLETELREYAALLMLTE